MANNTIKKGDIITIKEIKSGHNTKGDWQFMKCDAAEKITIWAENKDFKAEVGDTAEILDICSVSVSIKKVNDKYYTNFNISALLKNKGATAMPDFADSDDTFDDEEDIFK